MVDNWFSPVSRINLRLSHQKTSQTEESSANETVLISAADFALTNVSKVTRLQYFGFIMFIEKVSTTDSPQLIQLWEASVRATHHFFVEAVRITIAALLPVQ